MRNANRTCRGRAWAGAAALAAALAATLASPGAAGAQPAVLLAAGDIASCTSDGDEATARLLDENPGTVATLGDNAYPSGTPEQFAECYDPTWGRAKVRTRPSPGNHDYHTPGAAGYYGYFGDAAGDPSKGYYSYDLGAWHVVALNSVCNPIGGCGPGSPQEQWLRADLAANPADCTLAYWHHARFSSSRSLQLEETEPLWQALYEHGADVILSGHDHIYERFAPQTPAGDPNAVHGIRQFTVGTGGHSHFGIATRLRTSEVVNTDTYGILKLTLHERRYDWVFLPEEGKTFRDAGSSTCHGRPRDVRPPTVSLTSPPAGTVLTGPVTLAAEARDNVALARVDFLLGQTVVATDTTAPYRLRWDSSQGRDGAGTMAARAVDTSGNATTSSEHSVVVENRPPETTITRNPRSASSSTAATFRFAASEAPASFQCSLDRAPFAPCTSPAAYADLREGAHTFAVRAIDGAGKEDATPATWTWRVDRTAPETRITSGPRREPLSTSATFSFAANERTVRFQCSLDGSRWERCTSPRRYARLARGAHLFQVRSLDEAGNIDLTPATKRWVETRTVIAGSPRGETLAGTPGDDIIRTGGGNDVVFGGAGNDVVDGEAGDDRLVGGAGRDTLLGGAGADTLVARDGARDLVGGGAGRDRARTDRLDRVRGVEKRF